MVFLSYSTMQMAAKIVYYGPGLGGKTTNLQYIYDNTSTGSRGEMVSLDTDSDRTLFFDLLPIEIGSISGFQTRIQLYTVPGQVFYNATRRLVLKGVDGVVFVADSQLPMQDTNVESLRNLEVNLHEVGVDLDEIPVVLQFNKQDLPGIASTDKMDALLNSRGWTVFEASALTGQGVFDTLKGISKLTLSSLRHRLSESANVSLLSAEGATTARRAGAPPLTNEPRTPPPPEPTSVTEEPPQVVPRGSVSIAAPTASSASSSDQTAALESESESSESLQQMAARILNENKVRTGSETAADVGGSRLDAHADDEGPDIDDLSELRLSKEEIAMKEDSTLLSALDPEPESIPVGRNGDSNSRLEMSREVNLEIPRTLLGKTKHLSMSLRLEDSEDRIVGSLERRFALSDHDPDLAELLLRLNVTLSSND